MSTTTDSEREQAWEKRWQQLIEIGYRPSRQATASDFYAGYDAALASPTVTALVEALEQARRLCFTVTVARSDGGGGLTAIHDVCRDALANYKAARSAS